MSYPCSVSDAKAAIASVELSESTRTSSGSSKILHGEGGPGGAAAKVKPAGEHLEQRRTKLKTKTSSLRRSA